MSTDSDGGLEESRGEEVEPWSALRAPGGRGQGSSGLRDRRRPATALSTADGGWASEGAERRWRTRNGFPLDRPSHVVRWNCRSVVSSERRVAPTQGAGCLSQWCERSLSILNCRWPVSGLRELNWAAFTPPWSVDESPPRIFPPLCLHRSLPIALAREDAQ